MSAIKNFFQKRKLDRKFRQAGTGHTLNSDTAKATTSVFAKESQHGEKVVNPGTKDKQRSISSLKAGEAALARTANQVKQSRPVSSKATWKNPVLKAEVKREVEGSRNSGTSEPKELECIGKEVQNPLMLPTILFACPLCPTCLPEAEIQQHIEQCLHNEISSEPAMVAAAMIYTLNEANRVNICVEILNKYLENIIKNPCEEKYRKIRLKNKVFQDKVKGVKGVNELLTMAVGFVQVKLPVNTDEGEEDFYLLSEGLAMETERLQIIKDYLHEAEALLPVLDRNVKVYRPVSGATILDFPDEFYSVSNQELKREQQEKTANFEKTTQLSTKAMKVAQVQQQKKLYRFTLIRIRFPDDHILEGTFFSNDKFAEVVSFVKNSLEMDWLPFQLSNSMGKVIEAHESSIEKLGLSPATILNFRWDQCIADDVEGVSGKPIHFLSSELLASVIEL